MPLDKSGSKKSFSNNIAIERKAGKPENQAIAIAYSIERENEKIHKERYAHEKNKYGR